MKKPVVLCLTLLGILGAGCFHHRSDGTGVVKAFPSQDPSATVSPTETAAPSPAVETTSGAEGTRLAQNASPSPAFSLSPVPGGTTLSEVAPDVKIKEARATFHFRNMRLEEILKLFSRESGANFITDEKVRNMTFTAYFEDVTIREALDALLSSRGLGYERYPQSNIYVVKQRTDTKARTVTRLFRLNNVLLGDGDSGGSSSSSGGKSGFTFVDTSSKSSGGGGDSKSGGSNASGIISVIQGLLSENGKIQVEPYTNSLIITDLPERFAQIETLLEQLDVRPPQVSIEVQVVEVNSSKLRHVGVKYGLSDGTLAKLYGPAQPIQFPKMKGNWIAPTTSSSGSSSGGSGGSSYTGLLSLQELGVVLRAIETSGAGDYLARPNIITLNNKPAVLSVTADTAVGIQSASMISQSGLLATTAERYRTGITLRVTPQVSTNDWILLQISPTISRPNDSQFFPGEFVDPQDVNLTTSVRVKAGETLLLGGLFISQKSKSQQRLPILGAIPIVGALFKDSENSSSKDELMIFITPRIVGR